MSAENVETMRRGYERFIATGDPPEDTMAPGFVWDMSTFRGLPERKRYEGIEGMREFMANWTAAWEDWRLEVEELLDAGDQVVAIVRQNGRSKATGLPVDMPSRSSGRSRTASRRTCGCTRIRRRRSELPG